MFQPRSHRTSVRLKGESEAGAQRWCCLYPFPNLGLHTRFLLAKQQCPLLSVSHLLWTGQSHPNKTWRVLKESFTLSCLQTGPLLAFMCFCLNYHKALLLCGWVEEGTLPALCARARAPGTKPGLYLCLLIPVTACLHAQNPQCLGSPYRIFLALFFLPGFSFEVLILKSQFNSKN